MIAHSPIIQLPSQRRCGRPPLFESPKIRNAVRCAFLDDVSPKEVAGRCSLGFKTVYRMAYRLGLVRMYVTKEEREEIMARRRSTQEAA